MLPFTSLLRMASTPATKSMSERSNPATRRSSIAAIEFRQGAEQACDFAHPDTFYCIVCLIHWKRRLLSCLAHNKKTAALGSAAKYHGGGNAGLSGRPGNGHCAMSPQMTLTAVNSTNHFDVLAEVGDSDAEALARPLP
jgi:hypothetical protein